MVGCQDLVGIPFSSYLEVFPWKIRHVFTAAFSHTWGPDAIIYFFAMGV